MFCLFLSLSAGDYRRSSPNMSCYHKPDHSVISSNPLTTLLLSLEKQSSEENEREKMSEWQLKETKCVHESVSNLSN